MSMQKLYIEVNRLYNNPVMYKIRDDIHKNHHLSSSVYFTKVKSLLSKDRIYLYANVALDNHSIGTQFHLNTLHWKCFQARTSDEYIVFKHPQHTYLNSSYTKPTEPTDSSLHSIIDIKERTSIHNVYTSIFYPVYVVIIHKDDTYHYRDTGTIYKALELYNTLLIQIT